MYSIWIKPLVAFSGIETTILNATYLTKSYTQFFTRFLWMYGTSDQCACTSPKECSQRTLQHAFLARNLYFIVIMNKKCIYCQRKKTNYIFYYTTQISNIWNHELRFDQNPPYPPVLAYIHMHLFSGYGHLIFCNMHAYNLYLTHEHEIWTQHS